MGGDEKTCRNLSARKAFCLYVDLPQETTKSFCLHSLIHTAGHSINNAKRAVARPVATGPFGLDVRFYCYVPQ